VTYMLDVSTRSGQNMTPLMTAARDGHNEVVALLLEKNAPVNDSDRDSNGYTALHHAIINTRGAAVKLLLDKGGALRLSYDVVIDTHRVDSIFVVAVMNKSVNVLKVLLDNITTVNTQGIVLCAAYQNKEAMVKVLLTHITDKHERSKQANVGLSYAASAGLSRIMSVFLNHGANVEHRSGPMGMTALMIVAEAQRVDCVNALIFRWHANVNATTVATTGCPSWTLLSLVMASSATGPALNQTVSLLVGYGAKIPVGPRYDAPSHWRTVFDQGLCLREIASEFAKAKMETMLGVDPDVPASLLDMVLSFDPIDLLLYWPDQ
jgi:hypothetical protein